MTKEQLHSIIRLRFEATVMAAKPDLKVSWPNHELDPKPTAEVWVELTFLDGDTIPATIGENKRYRLVGVFSIKVYSPIRIGTAELGAIEDLVTKHFRSKYVDSVIYRTVSGRNLGRDRDWYVRAIDVPFQTDSFDSDYA